jgi:hypothetical protein
METSVEIVRVEPSSTAEEQQALAGFLSGHRGLTREAYALDLGQFVSWCCDHHLGLFAARRIDIECFFARQLEVKGKAGPRFRADAQRVRDPGVRFLRRLLALAEKVLRPEVLR